MTDSSPDISTNDMPKSKIKNAAGVISILIVLVAAASMFLAFRFADSERSRDQLAWQQQMSIILGGREAAVEEWLADQSGAMAKLTDNDALKIYLAQLLAAQEATSSGTATAEQNTEILAQQAYLENQLKAFAVRNGYVAPTEAFQVNANIDRPKIAGLALTDAQGQLMASTPDMPTVTRAIAAFLQTGARQAPLIHGPYPVDQNVPVIAVVAPIFAVQEDANSPAIGFAVGIKPLTEDFYRRLIQPGDMSRTAKSYLVQNRGGGMEFLSPLQDRNGREKPPLSFVLDENTPDLAAKFAVDNPGRFARKVNYDGQDVMVTGRLIEDTNWTLVRTVEAGEVLNRVEARQRNIIGISLLIIMVVTVLILLFWRHGVSVRVSQAAERQRILAQKFEKLSDFLKLVSDSQPTSISAVNEKGEYTFVNRQAAEDIGLEQDEIIGRPLHSALDKEEAVEAEEYTKKVLADEKAISLILEKEQGAKTIIANYLPLLTNRDKSVLMVMEDISELVQERQKRESALKNLVKTLTRVIDGRDPFSAKHSERVAEVAMTIGQELSCDQITLETVEIAGALMNLGKIMVPRELLTRPGALSKDELGSVRESIQQSADMLEGVEFNGPVVATLRQLQENWDGSGGPEGLIGEDILLSARIVTVANAFVGMVSARAHRAGMPANQAALLLMSDADKIFDRRPVTALMNFLENKNGYEKWLDFGRIEEPEGFEMPPMNEEASQENGEEPEGQV